MSIRLDKYLCGCGKGTRTEVKKLIKSKRVSVNGAVVTKADTKISDNDAVVLDGEVLKYSRFTYIMLNKPGGYISAVRDDSEKTVMELLEEKYRSIGLFPAGRLDKDTRGLLILTNDGGFAHRTLSPSKHVSKTYFALVSGDADEKTAEIFNKGVTFKGFTYKSAELIIEGKQNGLTAVRVTIYEGRYHQIKLMFEAVGCRVEYLKRLSFGEIELDDELEEGSYRLLNEKELEYIGRIKK